MARTDNLNHFLTDVADAIRTKKGTQGSIAASDFDTEIENLPSGGDVSDYFTATIDSATGGNSDPTGIWKAIKKVPSISPSSTSLMCSFRKATNLEEVTLTNVQNVTTCYQTFVQCPKLKTVNINGTFNSLTNATYMFSTCGSLVSPPLFDTSKVTASNGMFMNDNSLENLPQYDFSSTLSANDMFWGCSKLTEIPQFNFSSAQGISNMFKNCSNLVTVPELIVGASVTNASSIFSGCSSLSNDSLNNIMAMCINMTNCPTKTLAYIGLTSAQATTCTGLSNYADFVNAGWTTGY